MVPLGSTGFGFLNILPGQSRERQNPRRGVSCKTRLCPHSLLHPSPGLWQTRIKALPARIPMQRSSCQSYPSAGGTGTAECPGFCHTVELWGVGEGMCCSTLGVFHLPFAEVSDELLCFPWAFTIFPRNLSLSLASGSFSLPLCCLSSSRAKITTFCVVLQEGSFPSPSVTELLTAVSALGRFSFSLFNQSFACVKLAPLPSPL